MIVWLNGGLVAEIDARVSVMDRGFLYGDGLFATVRAFGQQLFLWERHWDRLTTGARVLSISLPWGEEDLHGAALEVLARNGLRDAVVRLQVTRGRGPRGYSTHGVGPSTGVIVAMAAPGLEAEPAPPRRLRSASLRLNAGDPLGRIKTTSKLTHIMARAEAEAAGADDALLLNGAGHVAEASSANVFWLESNRLCTPAVGGGALAGVTRELVLDLAQSLGWAAVECDARPETLLQAAGVFLTSSGVGVVEVAELDGQVLKRDPRVGRLQEAYREAVRHKLAHLSD